MYTNAAQLKITQTARMDSKSGAGGSEVVAVEGGKFFVTNGATEKIDVFNSSGSLLQSISLSDLIGYNGVNSVAVKNGIVAAAVQLRGTFGGTTTQGVVVLMDAATGTRLNTVQVGYDPDMVTFTPDGKKILVANEGEPDANFDAPGSVSVIDVSTGAARATVTDVSFASLNGTEAALRAQGVRIFAGKTVAADFEPEYIAVSADSSRAFVTLQENNAVAEINLATLAVTAVRSTGTTNHSLVGNELDPSDKDGIKIGNWPLLGLRLPDSIATFDIGGTTYYATANEGDDRGEAKRLSTLTLDATRFPTGATLKADSAAGRINISTIDGDTDGDGDYDALYSYGSRSFTIFNAQGTQVFDSGADFEKAIAQFRPTVFNEDQNDKVLDSRSDNKGPEPEAIAVGQLGDQMYAFIGMERDSGLFVYNVTTPANAKFVAYMNNASAGDVGPEVIRFIDGRSSGTGAPQLAIANEISGTTTLYTIHQIPDGSSVIAFGASGHAATIHRLYDGILNRNGDLAGTGYWVSRMEKGSTITEVARAMLGSTEAASLATLSNDGFIEQMYQRILNRSADSAGKTYWTGKLGAGTSRGELVANIADSAEAKLIGLGQAADGIEYTPWLG